MPPVAQMDDSVTLLAAMETQRVVAELAHLKESSVPARDARPHGIRVPWQGGTISSNKEEALRKFYARKMQAGDESSLAQIRATQSKRTARPCEEIPEACCVNWLTGMWRVSACVFVRCGLQSGSTWRSTTRARRAMRRM